MNYLVNPSSPGPAPDSRAVVMLTLFLSGGLFWGMAVPDPAIAQMHAEEDTSELQVSAEGEVEVQPDRAVISFAVETEAASALEASEENAALMDRVLAAVRETELEGMRAETTGYRLTPRYSNTSSDAPREIVGYTALNHLRVTMDQVDEVGRVLDRALDAGANRVAGLDFQVRDPQPHREEALRRAVETARAEAEAVADALGVTLGAPLEVQASSSSPPGIRLRTQVAAMSDEATTPVEAGMQTISANVSIRYRIHP